MTVSCLLLCHLERRDMSVWGWCVVTLLKLRVERSPAAMHPIPLRREIPPLCFAAVEMIVEEGVVGVIKK